MEGARNGSHAPAMSPELIAASPVGVNRGRRLEVPGPSDDPAGLLRCAQKPLVGPGDLESPARALPNGEGEAKARCRSRGPEASSHAARCRGLRSHRLSSCWVSSIRDAYAVATATSQWIPTSIALRGSAPSTTLRGRGVRAPGPTRDVRAPARTARRFIGGPGARTPPPEATQRGTDSADPSARRGDRSPGAGRRSPPPAA